jgi:hypothetical protein
MSHSMHLTQITAANTGAAQTFARVLIERSAWFALTPLPNDEWRVEFKPNEGHYAAVQERAA